MAGLLRQVALVSQVEELATEELRRVAATLQTQIARDFGPTWSIEAKLTVFPTVTDVPTGFEPIVILRELDTPGTNGVHLDKDGVPFAQVAYGKGAAWTISASHQCLDMLADPFGNRIVRADSPKPGQGKVEMLVEVCDPCLSDQFAYRIDDVLVSDFVTPAYYGGADGPFDFGGHIEKPLEVLDGGYLSWHDPATGHWWQLTRFGDPEFHDLGQVEAVEPPADEGTSEEEAPPPKAKRATRKRPATPTPAAAPEAEPAAELDGLGALPGAVNDQVAEIDQLGFRDYVIAFADLIESPETTPPITIGIYGAWGSGKSFLLRHIETELRERQTADRVPRVHVVRFNAWEYSASDAIWPSLVRRVVLCVEKEVPWRFPGRFWRKLWRNFWWELRQERGRIFGALFAAALIGALVLWSFDFRAGPLVAAAAALGAAGLLKVVADTISSPLSRWMSAVITSGEYGEQIGVMSRIQSDLEQLSRRLAAEKGRFVVMIDDLDRCEPEKVVEVLQAINLLLNFESFVVVLGIDARLVTGAIERHYQGLLGEAGASGYEYLDKIVQIPFRIPRPTAPEVQTFVSSQLQEAVGEANGASAPEPQSDPKPARAARPSRLTSIRLSGISVTFGSPNASKPVAFDPREIAAFEGLATLLEPNPRHLKRLINVYRLVRSLAGVRHVETSVRGDPEGVILLLTLAAQWPYTAAAMLEQVGPIAEAEAAGGSWPEGTPLQHLHGLADIDPERQRELDRDLHHLDLLLDRAEGHLGWKPLVSLQRYVVNFNPAVEEELRRGRRIREGAAADG